MSLAAYPGMLRRDRRRLGLRECRAASLLGLKVREYRQLEAGEAWVSSDLLERMVEFEWPRALGRSDEREMPDRDRWLG
jgi:hypothetical protein